MSRSVTCILEFEYCNRSSCGKVIPFNPEFHTQCSASAAVLSKKKVSERDSEPRDPTDAVKDWVKSVDVLKAEPDNPFGDDLEFYHVQAEAAFRDSGYYDGVVDKSPFDLKPSITALISKGLSQKEATAVIDEIVAKANKNKPEKAADDDVIFVPGLDKCFTENSDNNKEYHREGNINNMNANAIKSDTKTYLPSQKSDIKRQDMKRTDTDHKQRKTKVTKTETESDNKDKTNMRPKSLERDIRQSPDKTVNVTADRQDDSSPDSEYQSGKESLASESDNTNEAQTPGSEVESSVDTGEVFTNDIADDNAGTGTDIDRAAENCIIS